MAQFASDNFNGTEGDELSVHNSDWVNGPTSLGKHEISSNRCRHNSTTSSIYRHATSPASADYSVKCDIYAKTLGVTENAPGVVGRASSSAVTFYWARYDGGSSKAWQLYKAVSGTYTNLGESAQTLSTDTAYEIKLDMSGTAIKLFKESEGTAVVSVTDSAITAKGQAGIRTYSAVAPTDTTGIHIDNWSADEVSAAYTLVCDSGAYTVTGTDAGLIKDSTLTADSGSYTYSGTALDLIKGVALTADSGSYVYTGTIVDLVGSGSLVMGSGTYTYSGTDAALDYNVIMAADSGTYTYTGTAADLTHGNSFQLDSGSYVVTGTAIAFNVASVVSLDSGIYNYTGNSVSLVFSGGTWTVQPDSTTSWAAQSDSNATWTIQ